MAFGVPHRIDTDIKKEFVCSGCGAVVWRTKDCRPQFVYCTVSCRKAHETIEMRRARYCANRRVCDQAKREAKERERLKAQRKKAKNRKRKKLSPVQERNQRRNEKRLKKERKMKPKAQLHAEKLKRIRDESERICVEYSKKLGGYRRKLARERKRRILKAEEEERREHEFLVLDTFVTPLSNDHSWMGFRDGCRWTEPLPTLEQFDSDYGGSDE